MSPGCETGGVQPGGAVRGASPPPAPSSGGGGAAATGSGVGAGGGGGGVGIGAGSGVGSGVGIGVGLGGVGVRSSRARGAAATSPARSSRDGAAVDEGADDGDGWSAVSWPRIDSAARAIATVKLAAIQPPTDPRNRCNLDHLQADQTARSIGVTRPMSIGPGQPYDSQPMPSPSPSNPCGYLEPLKALRFD
jgi:hypothetical protein